FVWRYPLGSVQPPKIPNHTLYYCQDEPAPSLKAIGQNLKWYTSLNGTGTTGGYPTPNTSVPGTYKWYVTQSIVWESPKDSITVIVYPKPNPVITWNGTYLQTSGNYSAYQWILNGGKITGATSDTLTPIHFGSYTVTVADSNSCKGTSAPFIFTNINSAEKQSFLKVFPNPSDGKRITIHTNGLKEGNYRIELYNALGQKVIQKSARLKAQEENIL